MSSEPQKERSKNVRLTKYLKKYWLKTPKLADINQWIQEEEEKKNSQKSKLIHIIIKILKTKYKDNCESGQKNVLTLLIREKE